MNTPASESVRPNDPAPPPPGFIHLHEEGDRQGFFVRIGSINRFRAGQLAPSLLSFDDGGWGRFQETPEQIAKMIRAAWDDQP